jgi:hypothetical protein
MGLELRAFILSHSSSLFCDGYFQDSLGLQVRAISSWLSCLSFFLIPFPFHSLPFSPEVISVGKSQGKQIEYVLFQLDVHVQNATYQ